MEVQVKDTLKFAGAGTLALQIFLQELTLVY